jgi:hypothetical protein
MIKLITKTFLRGGLIMQRKLMVVVVMALVLGLALAPNAFARKPNPMPGPQVVKNFDGDVYLFADPNVATSPDPAVDPWGKFSWELWGEELMFHFKAEHLADGLYTLKVGTTTIGSGPSSLGLLSIQGPAIPEVTTSLSGAVTLEGPSSTTVVLTSFYSVKFTYVPAP